MNVEKLVQDASSQCGFAEVIAVEAASTPIVFKSGCLHSAESNYTRGWGLRVVKNGRVGFSSTNRDEDGDGLLQKALSSAKYGDLMENDFVFPKESTSPKKPIVFSKTTRDLSSQEMTEKGLQLISEIKALDKIQVDAGVTKSVSNVTICNSAGVLQSEESTNYSIYAYGVKVEDDGLLWTGDGYVSVGVVDLFEKNIVSTIKNQLVNSKKRSKPSKSGKMPVVFVPSALSFLLETFDLGISGKTHQKGISPIVGKLGQKITGDNITITNRPHVDYMSGSALFDRDGIYTKELSFIENGVFKHIAADLKTAINLGIAHTGNAAGGYASLPSIGYNNIFISPGNTLSEDIIKNVKNGLLVESVLGGGQSNTLSGDFSVNISLGYHIVNGEIAGRVKDLMISGNVYEIFKEADLSSDLVVKGSLSAPHILFNNVNVSL